MVLAGVGAGATLQGCSDDDTVTPVDAGKDTSPTNTVPTAPPPADADLPDTFVPPKPAVQKIIFVHAANYLGAAFEPAPPGNPAEALNGAIRLCLKSGAAGANQFLPIAPLPSQGTPADPDAGRPALPPGILRGSGGVLPSAGTDFSNSRLEGFALNAGRLAAKGITNTPCNTLFQNGYGPDGGVGAPDAGEALVEGVDYVNVGVINSGTFGPESTFVVSISGCAAGAPNEVVPRCGATYTGANTLKLNVVKLDRGAVGATELGAQFIHLATAAEVFPASPPANLPIVPGVITPGSDGGADGGNTFKGFATAPVTPADGTKVTALVKLAGVDLTRDRLSFNPTVAAVSQYPFESAVTATQARTPVVLGKGYVYIAVGEPQRVRGVDPDNTLLHFLAFPTDPVAPPLAP